MSAVAPRREGVSVDRECLAHALDFLSAGVVVADPHGFVHHMNAVAAEIIGRGDGLQLRHGVLIAQRAAECSRLREAVAANQPTLVLISRTAGAPYQLWVTRSYVESRSGSRCAGVVIIVAVPDAERDYCDRLLRDLYEFTPTEARLAVHLMNGRSLGQAAKALGIASQTAKSHLKKIFLKTHTRRQSQLVHQLMQSVAALRTAERKPELRGTPPQQR